MSGESCGPVDLKVIREWLESGVLAGSGVLLKWEVLEEERDEDGALRVLRASCVGFPVNLVVLSIEGPSCESGPCVARLVIETGIPTVDLDSDVKLRLYRLLLLAGRLALAKFYLYGEEHYIGIAADLDLRSLSRGEFEDYLAMLVAGYLYLRELPGMEEILREKELDILAGIVLEHLKHGEPEEKVVESLEKMGLPKDIASRLVSALSREQREAVGSRKGETLSI